MIAPQPAHAMEDQCPVEAISDVSTQRADRVHYYLLLAAAILCLLVPVWSVHILPWTDLGDHLSRAYTISHYGQVPQFRKYISISAEPLPNLAVDLVLLPLLAFFAPLISIKIFASLTVVVFAAGCHLFGRAMHAGPTWLTIPVIFLFYNSLLLYGFVNYMWGVSLFLAAAAAFLAFEKKPTFLKGTLATGAATATYFAHLSGLFFLCIFIGIYTTTDAMMRRRIRFSHLAAFVPLIPSLLFYASLSGARGDTSLVLWATLREKIIHLWVLFSGYSTMMDIVTAASLAILAFGILRYGKFSMAARPLALSSVFLLAYIVFPTWFHTGSDADTRFLLPFAITAALGARLCIPRRTGQLLFVLLLSLLMVRVGWMAAYWQRADAVSMEQLSLVNQMEVGSVVYPMIFLPRDRTESKIRQQLLHLAGYSTVERHAISGNAFAVPGQQITRRRIPLWYNAVDLDTPVTRIDWNSVLSNYDYVWAYNSPPAFDEFLASKSTLVAQRGLGRLYRMKRSSVQ
jgi:hypothetical protein